MQTDRSSSLKILVFIACIVLFFWVILSLFKSMSSGPGSGGPVPEFTAVDLAGQTWSSTSLKGKVAVLDFWATWCAPCMVSLPSMKEFHQRMNARTNLAFLGISLDRDAEKFTEFVGTNGVQWPQVCDGKAWDTPLVKGFGVSSIPQIFVVDKKGTIRFRNLTDLELEVVTEKLLEEDDVVYMAWKKENVPIQGEYENIIFDFLTEAEPLVRKKESELKQLPGHERTSRYLEIVAAPYMNMAKKLEEFIVKHPAGPWYHQACFRLSLYYADTAQYPRARERGEEALKGEAHLLYSTREEVYYLLVVVNDLQQNPHEVRRLADLYRERYPDGRFLQVMAEVVKKLPQGE